MITNQFKIREYSSLSMEEFENIYGRKPEVLKITSRMKEKDYRNYARSEEAFFGENNEFKMGMIALIAELRVLYQEAISKKNDKSVRRSFSMKIKPTITKIEKFIEKSFNVKKCYFGLIDDLNAWCIPMCFDSNLVVRKDKKTFINEKLKVDLNDIVETKNGFKYKNADGKTYCISFGIHFLDKKGNDDLFTDEECVAIISHELGHAMQQAVCSINENLASVYIHSLFEDIYSMLNPLLGVVTFGIAPLIALFEHKQYKDMKEENPEYLGDQIIKDEIGMHKKDYDRQYFGEIIEDENEKQVKKMPTKKDKKVLKFFLKFFMFTIGGACKILLELLTTIFMVPSNIYATSQKGFLNKNRRFEQFADVFAASYGLGPAQASALAKLGNMHGYKQDYGIFSLLNYVPVVNIITGVSHYTNLSMQQLVYGYPDMTGRMAAMYKSLNNDLNNNKDLSPEDKKAIQEQIDRMNDVYNNYVYDWSPKGFVYAIWHKITFKTLKNEKSDVEANVLDALKDFDKERKLKQKPTTSNSGKEIKIDSNRLMSAMLNLTKDFKSKYGTRGKKLIDQIEPDLRKL